MAEIEPQNQRNQRWILIVIGLIAIFGIGYATFTVASPRILPGISVGGISVGGMTRDQALQTIIAAQKTPDSQINVMIENKAYLIHADAIDATPATRDAVQTAWDKGRSGWPGQWLYDLLAAPLVGIRVPLSYSFDPAKLHNEIDTIAKTVDEPGKDIRLRIVGSSIELLTDTKLGFVLDRVVAFNAVAEAVQTHASRTRPLSLTLVKPTINLETTPQAIEGAERIIADSLRLTHGLGSFTIEPEALAAWVESIADGPTMRVELDEQQISQYVTTMAQELNAEPKAPKLTVVNGKVTDFVAPQSGRTLDQSETIHMIIDALHKRRDNAGTITELALPVRVELAVGEDESAAELGITELIGTASTRLTGSPKNRISNIKNGVKFLNGILVKPGEEFSTLKTLGTIDNTSGYLPELVIKEDRTVPEFGGGLCQVSTTLFRATLNTGLPITARQNHSYRVVYYERDGDGKTIGPGLDATIYNPAPDFRFLNDTKTSILIQGYVVGDKITFDFYGTKDGRISKIDGPRKISESPAGDPIYTETDTLKPGEKKQIEYPHPGGSAIATYDVTYPDGTIKEQVFKSFYRPWPARFLVGIDPNKPATTTPTEIIP